MKELKTLYILEAVDEITRISLGYRMPLGINPGAIRFTNDIENAAMFKELDDAKEEIDNINKHYPTAKVYVYEVERTAYKIMI